MEPHTSPEAPSERLDDELDRIVAEYSDALGTGKALDRDAYFRQHTDCDSCKAEHRAALLKRGRKARATRSRLRLALDI